MPLAPASRSRNDVSLTATIKRPQSGITAEIITHRGAAMVAGYRCSVFGIAVVDATVRTNAALATAPITGAFGQQDFVDRNHKSPSVSVSVENDNARGSLNQTARETPAPQLPDALSDVTAGKPAASAMESVLRQRDESSPRVDVPARSRR